MKAIIISCVLALSIISTEAVKGCAISYQRKIDITISGWVLYSTSQAVDGIITSLEVYDSSGTQLLLIQTGNGTYACSLDVSDLTSGNYVAKVHCANTTHTEPFTL